MLLVEIQFDKSERISGAAVQTFCLKDLVFAKFQILKETTTAFTFSVQHHLRYSCFVPECVHVLKSCLEHISYCLCLYG